MTLKQMKTLVSLQNDKCHSKIHDKDDNSIQIKKLAQRKFETIYPRDLWVKEFGKNYLWEEEE